VCLLRARTWIFIYLYINHLDVSHSIALTRRLEWPDSVAEAWSMSLKLLACLPVSCAELKWVSVRIQWPPACNTTPGLAEATKHDGITVIHSTRFEAVMQMVMELNASVFNTLPSGHAEMRDYCPMRCWRVTHFCVFLCDVLHMRFTLGLAHLSLQGYRQLDAGCLGV